MAHQDGNFEASSGMGTAEGNRTYAPVSSRACEDATFSSAPAKAMASRGNGARRLPMLTAIAVLAGLAGTASAQLSVFTQGADIPAVGPGTKYPQINACNETNAPQQVEGWRFHTKDFGGYTTWMPKLTKTGTAPVEYTQILPDEEHQMQAGACRSAGTDYTGTLAAGQDATPFDLQALIKIGSCSEMPPYKDAAPATCMDVDASRGAAAYYGNQCIIDSIGSNGGDTYGGFVSTFYGQTQIQAAIPTATISISGTPVKWNPYAMGPQYMMALAMGQEIMNVDMQFLTAIAGKETGAGMVNQGNGQVRSEDGSYTDNGTFGYWQIEDATFGTYIKAYPQFFPKYGPCVSKYADVTTAISVGQCAANWSEAAKFYMQPTGANKMGPNTPQIANGVLSSSIAWYDLYDALSLSTDLCFLDAIQNGADKRVALASMIVGYNLGRYTDFGGPFKDKNLKSNPNASNLFATGNNNYRPEIYSILDLLVNASKNCGARNIYDTAITLTEVQRFLFGGSVMPGTPVAQGDGGLLLHFPLSADERLALWTDVTCAFDKLKGKAPSTTGKAEAISYRYDWLTILRVVKQHLPFKIMDRKVPVEHDFQYVVDKYSQNPQTCSGKIKDETYPSLTITSPAAGVPIAPVVDPGFKVTFTGTDNVAVAKAEWSFDKNWLAWSPAAKTANPNEFQFFVSCQLPGYPKKGQKDSLWIRTTDDCGNATVQQFNFTAHSTANCGDPPVPPQVAMPSAGPRGQTFSSLLAGGLNVTLTDATPGASILYTVDGTDPDSVVGGATMQYSAPIAITATTTLKARGVMDGMLASAVMTEVYTKVEPGKVAKPAAVPPGRNFTSSLAVTLTDSTPGAVIYYTLDGTSPGTAEGGSTKRLAGPINLSASTSIIAIATRDGMYPSDPMVEKYGLVLPIAITAAWYLDENGDGRIDKAVVTFASPLSAAPDKLGFKIIGEDDVETDRTAAGGEITLAPGDASRVIVTFSDPFPFGVTSLKNASVSGQTFRQDAIPLADGVFAVADSVAPVIVKAVLEEGDSSQADSRLTLTYSEPVQAPPASQTAWVFKRKDAEMAPAEVRIASAQAQGANVTLLLIDTISTTFPIIGDSVAINTTGEIKDLAGRSPASKLFQVLGGTPPKSKPIRFAILNPDGSSDKPSPGMGTTSANALFIPLGRDGSALPGGIDKGRCQGCVAAENGIYAGPVFDIVTPGPLTYQFRIFNNAGEFLAEGDGRVDDQDLNQLKKDKAGKNYELPVVWTGKAANGTKAGTGAYIVIATFFLDQDPKTGALASKHTEKKKFGLIRKL